MADWYYAKNGKQNGPISSAELRQLAQTGQLLPDDLVFREGGTNWVAASTVNGLFPAGGGVAPKPQAGPAGPGRQGGSFDFDGGGGGGYDGGGGDVEQGPLVQRPRTGGNFWGDMFLFKRFVGPWVIIGLFYLAVVGMILYALFIVMSPFFFARQASDAVMVALLMAVLMLFAVPISILMYRIMAELTIVQFRIAETLREIKDELRKRDLK